MPIDDLVEMLRDPDARHILTDARPVLADVFTSYAGALGGEFAAGQYAEVRRSLRGLLLLVELCAAAGPASAAPRKPSRKARSKP